MRRATVDDRRTYHGGLSFEDSAIIAPAYVPSDFVARYGESVGAEILFQIQVDPSTVGVIRAAHKTPAEMLIDFGNGDLRWLHPDETIGLIGYGPVP